MSRLYLLIFLEKFGEDITGEDTRFCVKHYHLVFELAKSNDLSLTLFVDLRSYRCRYGERKYVASLGGWIRKSTQLSFE